MDLMKHKPIRIKDRRQLAALHQEVYDMDHGHCSLAGEHDRTVYIAPGTPAHHVNHGCNKEDVKENMLMICGSCHYRAHNLDYQHIKAACKEYLQQRDGPNKWNT